MDEMPLVAIADEEVESRLPGYHDTGVGHPIKYPPEVVESALYEVAATGGNVARACRNLADRGITQSYPTDCGRAIPHAVVRTWVKKRFRNRYHEIVVTGAREREAVVSERGIDLAIQISEAEEQALKQTLAGLPDASGYEASQILRNLSQSKASQVDNVHRIAAQGRAEKIDKTLEQVISGLRGAGLIRDEDEVVDADVVSGHELEAPDE